MRSCKQSTTDKTEQEIPNWQWRYSPRPSLACPRVNC